MSIIKSYISFKVRDFTLELDIELKTQELLKLIEQFSRCHQIYGNSYT